MALKEPFMLKIVQGNTDLSLEATTGKSLLVKDIYIYNPATSYLTIKTAKTTVGYFRVGGNLGNHLPLPIGSLKHSHGIKVAAADGSLTEDHALSDAFGVANAHIAVYSDRSALTEEANILQFGSIPQITHKTILALLREKGIFNGYPIAEGETMTFSGAKQAGALQVAVYEEYEAGDIKNTDPNGSLALEYFFVNYGRVAANVTTSTSTIFDTLQTPVEFPAFPFGDTVPSKTTVTIHGILASDVVDDRGSDDTMNTEYIKLIRERITLFDDDKNGILLKGIVGNTDGDQQIARGLSLIGNFSDIDGKPPLFFPEPLAFEEGEELNVYLTTVAGSSQSASDLEVADLEIGLIETISKAA